MNTENIVVKPTTEDWVKNRKFICVVEDDAEVNLIDIEKPFLHDESTSEQRTVGMWCLSFKDFLGVFTNNGNVFLRFQDERGIIVVDKRYCTFYKFQQPPFFRELKNKLKQNQI